MKRKKTFGIETQDGMTDSCERTQRLTHRYRRRLQSRISERSRKMKCFEFGQEPLKLLWHRTKTLGRGGDCCDFCLKIRCGADWKDSCI